ncbi:penicillin-binding protein activator [Croceicoccus sp. YJ47]|uniref:penicillin-binding protein activator n=1 Tax=Croceicoccus sp. YJ47 TaxID=2798724 RepID=UPI00192226E2|nr:penicillin-binding protein activator [Croceicoccus sp. YJ47]QQN74204.1 penicillin-binding protein activator [Croceicoccus sp. YJ47]
MFERAAANLADKPEAGERPGTLSRGAFVRRGITGALALALAGCAGIIPGSDRAPPPPPRPADTGPSAERLPDADEDRHRVALLVPLSGDNAAVGQSIANATTMALLDTNTSNIRITTYDTASQPGTAAERAIADGNRLILGPLLSDNIDNIARVAGPARVPIISFSNDSQASGRGVYIMGQVPEQSIDRTMRYAAGQGVRDFAALVPEGEYGRRASEAMVRTARDLDVRIAGVETYDRSATSITAAANRLSAQGGFGAVLIADGARVAVRAAPLLRDRNASARFLGTELWSGEADIAESSALRGAWFSAISDGRYRRFSDSYRSRFGSAPYRVATLGYDAVLLAINIAQEWPVGTRFPLEKLEDEGGFIGLDGAFRFDRDGEIERMFEVREVTANGMRVVSEAPTAF